MIYIIYQICVTVPDREEVCHDNLLLLPLTMMMSEPSLLRARTNIYGSSVSTTEAEIMPAALLKVLH